MPNKKIKKEIELPSFVKGLSVAPKDAGFLPKTTNSNQYLGPLFFGQCHQLHPPLHSLDFSTFRHIRKACFAKENIKGLFLEKPEVIKKQFTRPVIKFRVKPKVLYSDPYTHKAPGNRRVFVPEVKPPVIDLGQTTSVIEGETILEIPLHRVKKNPFSTVETEFELVMLSDIKEKKRILMPYKERISHFHFPKRFANVTVIGPTVPAAITITKLPSKRKTEFEMSLLIKSSEGRSSKEKAEEQKEEPQVDGGRETEAISSNEEQPVETSSVDNAEADVAAEESDDRGFNEVNLPEVEEETTGIREEESGEMDIAEETLVQEEEEEEEEEEEKGEKEDGEEGKNENVKEKREGSLNEEEPED